MRTTPALIIVIVTSACLDLDLANEVNWPDGSLPTDSGTPPPDGTSVPPRWDGSTWPDGASADAWADASSSDSTPPWFVASGACAPTETALGALCLSMGPRGIATRFWSSEPVIATATLTPHGSSLRSEQPAVEHHLVLGDLTPELDVELAITIEDAAGLTDEIGPVALRTAPLIAAIVITEVLMDPLGPEPRQEFVELINTGNVPISLDGWTLEDEGSADIISTTIELLPGVYALVVASGWIPGDGGDPSPAAGAVVFTLDGSIGSSGLRNSGESLVLRDSTGQMVSHFPSPTRATGAGISMERLDLMAPDGDPANWELNSSESSSPGAPPPNIGE